MDVLIIRPGALGDTLMLLPALSDLSDKAAITFVGRQPGLEFIRPYVHEAMDLETSGWHRLFADEPDDKRLPVSGAEVVVAFFSDESGVIYRNLRSYMPYAAVHLCRSFPLKGEDIHVAQYLGRCLKSAGLPVDPVRSIETIRSGRLKEGLGRSGKRSKIIFHPGSGSLEKNHPPDFWLNLFDTICRETEFRDLEPVILLGPAEERLHPYFRDNLRPGDVQILSSPNKEQLMETLNKAALCVGHDSGITHLSAMFCTPTVALFRESDPAQWAPLGPFVRVIQSKEADHELLGSTLKASRHFIKKAFTSIESPVKKS